MKRIAIVMVASTLLAACAHTAGTSDPPRPLQRPELIYGTQTSFGPCLVQGEAALLATIGAAVIAKGVNRIGAAIQAAAARQTTTTLARRNFEASNGGPLGPCVFVARGWFYRGRPTLSGQGRSAFIADPGSEFPFTNQGEIAPLWRNGLFLAATPDFYFEGQLLTSADQSAYTVYPLRAFLDEPLVTNSIRSDRRSVLISFAVTAADKSTDLSKGGGSTVVLGEMTPGVLQTFPPASCIFRSGNMGENQDTRDCPTGPGGAGGAYMILRSQFESEWFAVKLTAAVQPMTLQALVSETREASEFLGFVSTVFGAVESNLTTELQRALIPSIGDAAEETELGAEEALATAYDNSILAAFNSLTACVATPADGAKRSAARVAVRGVIAAARRAEIPSPPLTTDHLDAITVTGTSAQPCQDALDRLRQ